MNPSTTIRVITTNGIGVFIRGRGSRDLVVDTTGRQPVRTGTGWALQRKQLPDLLALADSRGYRVETVHDDAA